MILAINNNTTAQKPSFAGLKVFGDGASAYFAHRAKIEGQKAVDEFRNNVDALREWGYVNLLKSPKKDTVVLEGSCPDMGNRPITKSIPFGTTLNDLFSSIKFLAENNKTHK